MSLIVKGKSINLREIAVSDAEFILSLRTDPRYNEYLGKTDNDINKQREYIRKNAEKDDDIYFIVESKHLQRFGCARLYNITPETFNYGSWIIMREAPPHFGLETYFLVSDFAYYVLKLERAEFDVRKGNKSVVAFHKRMGAEVVDADDLCYYFRQTKTTYESIRKKYSRYVISVKDLLSDVKYNEGRF